MKRYAIVRNARTRQEAEAYLPSNYRVIFEGDVPYYPGNYVSNKTCRGFVIEGLDAQGWTFDGYVMPRYASGLIWAEEIDLSHAVMKGVPSGVVG